MRSATENRSKKPGRSLLKETLISSVVRERLGMKASGRDEAGGMARHLPQRLLLSSLLCGSSLVAMESAFGAGGDTQATATCIGSLPYNDTGTTAGATDNYDLPSDTTNPTLTATCATIANGAGPGGSLPRGAVYTGTGTAPDVVYQLSFPSGNPDTLTITMDPTGAQDLTVITYCNTVSSSLADGLAIDDTGVGGTAESVTVGNITAGTTLYIVVDGYSTGGTPPGPSGPYTLSVTSNGATQPAPCNGASSADLSITKTDGVTTATPGATTTYTIVASNAGPDTATTASVTDTFPAACTSVNYTSVAAGGATGNTAGPASGNINDTALNLPVGASVTYTAICDIDPTATGTLTNTATIASTTTDPDPANNSATDTNTLTASADLSITKTDGVGTATPGTPTTYTIVASNAGPSAVTGATVADTFPAACASVSYTSVAAGGATGNTAGPASGNINDTALNLPVGASVTYTASCDIDLTATGLLSNTAAISSAVTDPNPANNSATDNNTLIQLATLTIQLDAPGSAPTTFDFTTVGLTPTAFSLQHGQTQTFTNLIPGQSYTVNDQPPPPGWVLGEVLCSAPAPQCVTSSITLTPTEGQAVTGTFRFLRLGSAAEAIPIFSVWGLGALISLFGLVLARLRRRI